MRPTEVLREDHQVIGLMLDILEKMCGRLESGGSVEPEDLDTILGSIRSFVVPHQTLGEDLLLHTVDEAGVSMQGGALLVMILSAIRS